jgi:hypothetical protein
MLDLEERMDWSGLTTFGATILAQTAGVSLIVLGSFRHREKGMRLPSSTM